MVGDITYIPTWEGWVYLATVMDSHTKAVVGWAVDDNYKTPLISAAIGMAAATTAWPGAMSVLTGVATIHGQFAAVLQGLDIRQSVGRTGICYDNAMAESFFATLKTERVHHTSTRHRNAPAEILPATSSSITIPDVSTRASATRPRKRSTTST